MFSVYHVSLCFRSQIRVLKHVLVALYTVCMIVFLIFGSSELQDWAGAEKNKKPDLFLDIKDSNQRQDFIYATPKQNGHSNV